MPVREVLVHHFRLPRRGEGNGTFFIFLCFLHSKKLLQFNWRSFLLKYRYFK